MKDGVTVKSGQARQAEYRERQARENETRLKIEHDAITLHEIIWTGHTLGMSAQQAVLGATPAQTLERLVTALGMGAVALCDGLTGMPDEIAQPEPLPAAEEAAAPVTELRKKSSRNK